MVESDNEMVELREMMRWLRGNAIVERDNEIFERDNEKISSR